MPTAFAPGRIELIGNHTDYNEGLVLAFAVDLGVSVEAERRDDDKVILRSEGFGEETFHIGGIQKNPQTPWADYIKGVLVQLQATGAPIDGFEASVRSNLPHGAGMSSSAAIEVVTALIVQKLFDFEFGDMGDPIIRMAIARLCRLAETEFVGVQCGILDQATSLLGRKSHALFLDCRSEEVESIPMSPEVCFVICHTGAEHMLLSSKYNARRNECQEAVQVLQFNQILVTALRDVTTTQLKQNAGIFTPRIYQRAMHIASENERVLAAREALLANDMEKLGALLYDSHESSRAAFENSTPLLDQLVEIARGLPGCLGARLTGGGFGGATLSLVYRKDAEEFRNQLLETYRRQSGKEPRAWIVSAADGAA